MKKIDVSKSLIFSSKVKDLKNALEYLDQKGYFSNCKDFSNYSEGQLDVVHVASFMFSSYVVMSNEVSKFFSYFIPKSKVVFVEEEPTRKTLRAFNSREEFFNVTGFKVGDIVQLKRVGNLIYEETVILTSIRHCLDGAYLRIEISFGSTVRSLSELCENCKYYKNGEWLPFGVEE